MFFIFWPTRSTFCVFSTFYLAYCGLFTVKLSSTLLPKNSPPDCFLNGRLQISSFSLYIKNKKHRKGCFLFFGPPEVLFAFFLLSTSPTAACSQSNFHQRSSLKTVHRTVFLTVGFKSLRFLCVTKKQKTPQLWCLLFFWPTRRDLNPHSPESESVALSNCATDGYSAVFSYGFLYLINLKVLPKLHTVLPVHSAILRVYL